MYQTADVAGRQYIIPSTVVKQQEPDLASQPSQACLYPLTYGNKIWKSRDFELTQWIMAQKWYGQNMSLEKINFALWIKTKLGKKEFLKLYIVLLKAGLNCTFMPAKRAGWTVLVRWQLKRTMYDLKNYFSPAFVYIHRAKYIFSRDKFCLPYF